MQEVNNVQYTTPFSDRLSLYAGGQQCTMYYIVLRQAALSLYAGGQQCTIYYTLLLRQTDVVSMISVFIMTEQGNQPGNRVTKQVTG